MLVFFYKGNPLTVNEYKIGKEILFNITIVLFGKSEIVTVISPNLLIFIYPIPLPVGTGKI